MSDMSDSLRFYPSPAPMKYYTYQDEDIQRAKSLVQRGSSQTMAAEDMNKRAKQTLLKEYATNEKKNVYCIISRCVTQHKFDENRKMETIE